jgi:hypothetical protein
MSKNKSDETPNRWNEVTPVERTYKEWTPGRTVLRENHESFGQIRINRTSIGGRGVPLYGTSILHGNTIRLVISRSERQWDAGTHSHFEKETLTEVEMSASQFAEAITSLNHSSIPCTIRWHNGPKSYPEMTDVVHRHRKSFEDEIKDDVNRLRERITEAEELMQKQSLGKKDREQLMGILKSALQDLEKNQPFYVDQFERQMNLTMTEAKSEIEAFTMQQHIQAGQMLAKALSEGGTVEFHPPQLPGYTEDDNDA